MATTPKTPYVAVQVIVKGKPYTYLWPDFPDIEGEEPQIRLKTLDFVAVPFGKQGLQLGRVESVGQIPLDPFAKFEYKWIAAWIHAADDFPLVKAALEESARKGAHQ